MAAKEYRELIYKRPYAGKGQEPESPEFIVIVHAEEFERYKADPSSVSLVEVVDACEVFVSHNRTHTGKLEHATNAQLEDVFGSHKFEDVFGFMCEHGHITVPPKQGDFRRT